MDVGIVYAGHRSDVAAVRISCVSPIVRINANDRRTLYSFIRRHWIEEVTLSNSATRRHSRSTRIDFASCAISTISRLNDYVAEVVVNDGVDKVLILTNCNLE